MFCLFVFLKRFVSIVTVGRLSDQSWSKKKEESIYTHGVCADATKELFREESFPERRDLHKKTVATQLRQLHYSNNFIKKKIPPNIPKRKKRPILSFCHKMCVFSVFFFSKNKMTRRDSTF